MSRIVRLTESDLTRIVRRVIMEQPNPQAYDQQNYRKAVANWNAASAANGGFIETGVGVTDGGKMLQASLSGFDMNFQCGPTGASFYPGTNAQNSEYRAYFEKDQKNRTAFETAASNFCKTLWAA